MIRFPLTCRLDISNQMWQKLSVRNTAPHRVRSMLADSSLWTMTLRWQIENLAHGLEDRGRLTSRCNGQQHFHGRLDHLFYDASTK
jgi:hypothetical protein